VDAIRRAFEVYGARRDREAFLRMVAQDAVWDLSRSSFPDARVYHGREGVGAWLGGLDDAFEEIRYEVEEVTDLGEGRVLSVIRVKGHGKFSKIEVDYRFVPVFTFRGRKSFAWTATETAPRPSQPQDLRGRRCREDDVRINV
jgi:ketosteroid isomerase-like protein